MKPGPDATINGVIHKTVIDDRGVQRFQQNRIVRDLLTATTYMDKDGRWLPVPIGATRISLNEIAMATGDGRYTGGEWRELYRLIGYSIGGYGEIFPDDEIDNPLDAKSAEDR